MGQEVCNVTKESYNLWLDVRTQLWQKTAPGLDTRPHHDAPLVVDGKDEDRFQEDSTDEPW